MSELLSHLDPTLIQQLDFYFHKIDFIFLNRLSFLLFILAMLLATGLSLTVPQIIEPLRNWRLVIRSLIANLVIVPILVLGLLHFIPVSEPIKIGFTILAVAAGPPRITEVSANGEWESCLCRRINDGFDACLGNLYANCLTTGFRWCAD